MWFDGLASIFESGFLLLLCRPKQLQIRFNIRSNIVNLHSIIQPDNRIRFAAERRGVWKVTRNFFVFENLFKESWSFFMVNRRNSSCSLSCGSTNSKALYIVNRKPPFSGRYLQSLIFKNRKKAEEF